MSIDDLLDNIETESHSFLIDLRCSEQLTKSCEKRRFLLSRYTNSSVLHHYCQLVGWPAFVDHLKRNETCFRELEGVSNQIYHDLLYSSFVTNQIGYPRRYVSRKFGVFYFDLLNCRPNFDILSLRLRTEYLHNVLNNAQDVELLLL